MGAIACAVGGAAAAAGATDFLVGVTEDSPKWAPTPGVHSFEAPEVRALGVEAFRITVPWSAGQTQRSATTVSELNRAVSLLGPEFRNDDRSRPVHGRVVTSQPFLAM